MAKLNAYYGLCPLVDNKNFVGISKDAEHNHVIITQSKNIAIKYRLSDQKQIQSWRTRDKFTSPVVYDKEKDNYVAVFNKTTLRLWSSTDIENLDKLKKYTIKKPLHSLLNINNNTYVIFENCNILTLKTTLDERKNLKIDDIIDVNIEKIIDVKHTYVDDVVYICLIIKGKTGISGLLTSFPNDFPKSTYHKIELDRKSINLSGYTFCLMYNKYLYFLTLWSNGELYQYLVAGPSHQEIESSNSKTFGSLFGKMESISCKQNVAMISIASDHLAMYGADCAQEGARVLIYNTQFKVTQSAQTFKMFSNISKIWHIDNALLLCSGQHLAVIPFEVNTEQLSELVGSHKVDSIDTDIQQLCTFESWDISEENDYSASIPPKIREDVLICLRQGLSEITTCDIIIPTYINDANIEAIENCVDYFKDVSEECIIKILLYLVENHLSYDKEGIPNRNALIDKVLSIPFTNALLLPHIKRKLRVTMALHILKYISFLFSSEDCLPGLNIAQTEGKLIDWGCALLDGNYQKFLLTRDVAVYETLSTFSKIIQDHILGLTDFQSVESVISDFMKKKCISDRDLNSANYLVEDVKLY